jgi:hypothetical protein
MNGQSTGVGLGIVSNTPPSRESQVQKELMELSTAIKSVENNMSTLLIKLQPILRQEDTLNKTEAVNPQPSVVGLASVIREERKKLEYISNVLATAFIHLEL